MPCAPACQSGSAVMHSPFHPGFNPMIRKLESIFTLTDDELRDICTRYPRIAAAFWRETLIEGANFREWVTNVGRREAYQRMAHAFCELLTRLRAVGLVEDHACDLPITQGEFADAMGITNVHVNRVLQQMRAEGLIETQGTRLRIPDWAKLKQVGEFDP